MLVGDQRPNLTDDPLLIRFVVGFVKTTTKSITNQMIDFFGIQIHPAEKKQDIIIPRKPSF